MRNAAVRLALGGLLGLAILSFAAGDSSAQSLSRSELELLLAPRATAENQGEARTLLRKLRGDGSKQPMWPVYEFLAAELLLESGRPDDAARRYWNLVEHAASNPHDDTWGSNALVAFALYRWLDLKQKASRAEPSSFVRMSAWADNLLQTRLVRAAVEAHPILPSLPLLEEELYYRLAVLAKRAGMPKEAGTYFLAYLSRLRSDKPSTELDPLYDLVIEERISTPDRIALFRGRRLWSLGNRRAAIPYLKRASAAGDEQTRLEGSYLLARASRTEMTRAEKQAIYEDVYRYASRDDLAQEALFWNALQFGPEDPEFKAILIKLTKEYRSGSRRDDALFWLAKGEQIAGNLDAAVDWYRTLREIETGNDFVSRAALFPALGLMWRGAPGDQRAAGEILREFVESHPDSLERPLAQFWLGRIAEDRRDDDEARRWFEATARIVPLGYYGLRSRMHLADGKKARSQSLIGSPALRRELRASYSEGGAGGSGTGNDSVYSKRLQASFDNGLYQLAVAGEQRLREADSSKRLQEFTFEELDELGLLTRLAVMMALRQDALAAGDASGSVADRISLARRLGQVASDWTTAMSLVHPTAVRAARKRSELMSSPGYLSSAYPIVYDDLMREATGAEGAPAAILYAVMRQESFFSPAALSSAGALGLFQFMPSTFQELDDAWRLLEASPVTDFKSYLLDPRLSLVLASRWFHEKKLPAFDHEPLLAILAHHSGDGRVRKWRRIWEGRQWLDDVELMIESFRKPELDESERVGYGVEARKFARQVMTDLAIVDALGLYREGGAASASAAAASGGRAAHTRR